MHVISCNCNKCAQYTVNDRTIILFYLFGNFVTNNYFVCELVWVVSVIRMLFLYFCKIIIKGGGRGIGQACAIRLAQEQIHNKRYRDKMAQFHADCNKNSKNKNKNTKIKKPRKLKFKDRIFHKQCDVTDRKQVEETIEAIIKERGYIDVVLNCVNTDSHKIDISKFDRIMPLNLYSTVNVCNAVIPYMTKEQYGRIVN